MKSQRKLGQEEIDILKTAWANLYSNNEEAVVVLNNGLEFQEASNTSVEMQLNESKKAFIDEINAIFHIYPDDFERTFKEAIYPIVKAFETALNRDLLLEKEKDDYFFSFDVKEIIKASIKERYEAYKTAKETGFLTINEIRQEENLNYVEGLDVVNVGLGAVLYDTNTHTFYTPNTDTTTDISGENSGAIGDAVNQVSEIKHTPLLVGQIQALSDIVKGYQSGAYNYNQAKNMLMVGVGLSEVDADKVLDYQDNIKQKGQQTDLNKTNAMLEAHVMEQEFVADGNSSDA